MNQLKAILVTVISLHNHESISQRKLKKEPYINFVSATKTINLGILFPEYYSLNSFYEFQSILVIREDSGTTWSPPDSSESYFIIGTLLEEQDCFRRKKAHRHFMIMVVSWTRVEDLPSLAAMLAPFLLFWIVLSHLFYCSLENACCSNNVPCHQQCSST